MVSRRPYSSDFTGITSHVVERMTWWVEYTAHYKFCGDAL